MLTRPFFEKAENLYDLLAANHAVISGSCALRLLLPENDVCWMPDDLDIYVCESKVQDLLRTLMASKYKLTSRTAANDAPYTSSHIQSVCTLHHNSSRIDVIVSNSSTAISPIFQFHSTVLMNFVTAHSVFCAYPEMTTNQLSLINPFVVFCQPLRRSTLDALLKYSTRNIQYITCQQLHDDCQCCKDLIRSTDDESCMWLTCPPQPNPLSDQETFPCVSRVTSKFQ
ncbi:hypothetical protein EDD15DRAFT_2336219 [Pisolithus albus]|nr:hypothetical protein EDD15DRAFT_2336219 [Pisolithus albus]